jgi:hypothetical protein
MRMARWTVGVVLGAIATGLAVVLVGTRATKEAEPTVHTNPGLDPVGDDIVAPRPV